MNIGIKIKELRESKGLTQKELGGKIGVTAVTITRYEQNQRKPNLEALAKIAKALGVTISSLISSTENSFSTNLISAIQAAYINKNNGYPVPDIFKVLSDDLELDYKVFDCFMDKKEILKPDNTKIYALEKIDNNKFDKSKELPIDIQIKLLTYLSKLDYQAFLMFCESNNNFDCPNEVKSKIEDLMFNKISEIETNSMLAFKNYLLITFGDKINEFINEDNIKELQEETEKFLEFALFKIEKEYYDEDEQDE